MHKVSGIGIGTTNKIKIEVFNVSRQSSSSKIELSKIKQDVGLT